MFRCGKHLNVFAVNQVFDLGYDGITQLYGRYNDLFEVRDVNRLQLGFALVHARGTRCFEKFYLAIFG